MSKTRCPSLGKLIEILPTVYGSHANSTPLYRFLNQYARYTIETLNPISAHSNIVDMGLFGNLDIPYVKMGAIDTFDSFGLDELIIYAFYLCNKKRYSKVIDIGGNVGLHATLMARCGWEVETFEPDPAHISYLKRMLALNHVSGVTVNAGAVASRDGFAEFIRVLGNTTSSHLSGSKSNPYGPLERFEVPVYEAKKIARLADFIKIDAEGAEREILLSIDSTDWKHLDVIAEIGNQENGKKIFDHCQKIGVNIFAQKLNWERVKMPDNMPSSYREGSVFLSIKSSMPWN